jgi:hypothetical protein
LSWQLPIAPGQPGDDGRLVLLAVMDAEPDVTAVLHPGLCGIHR